MQYAQVTVVPGSDGRVIDRIECWKYHKSGHFADYCPEIVEGDQHLIDGYEVIDAGEEETPNLDEGSTGSVEEEESW
jgi:hypothetical protein